MGIEMIAERKEYTKKQAEKNRAEANRVEAERDEASGVEEKQTKAKRTRRRKGMAKVRAMKKLWELYLRILSDELMIDSYRVVKGISLKRAIAETHLDFFRAVDWLSTLGMGINWRKDKLIVIDWEDVSPRQTSLISPALRSRLRQVEYLLSVYAQKCQDRCEEVEEILCDIDKLGSNYDDEIIKEEM